jgi:8-oxo-dGTP diphosphatase
MLHRVKKKNDIHEGKWNGLGGKLEEGESPEECVIREVREESGLIIEKPVLKGFLTFPNFAGNDWYSFVFVAENPTGELIDSPEGNLKWIPTNEVTSLNLWDSDGVFIPLLDQPGIFSGKFVYENGKIREYTLNQY